jgi:hypothetical protein
MKLMVQNILKNRVILIVGLVLVALLCSVAVILYKIGSAYKSGINQISTNQSTQTISHIEKEAIDKITIKNENMSGCIEVTPDGAVRVYAECGQKVINANRPSDPKFILRFFKLMSDYAYVKNESGSCTSYLVTLYTKSGQKTVCLDRSIINNNRGEEDANNQVTQAVIDQVIDVIHDIINDIPPTPTIEQLIPTNTPTPTTYLIISPTDSIISPGENTPTPTVEALRPFNCNFTDSGGKSKPFNISNIVCSSGPTPAP